MVGRRPSYFIAPIRSQVINVAKELLPARGDCHRNKVQRDFCASSPAVSRGDPCGAGASGEQHRTPQTPSTRPGLCPLPVATAPGGIRAGDPQPLSPPGTCSTHPPQGWTRGTPKSPARGRGAARFVASPDPGTSGAAPPHPRCWRRCLLFHWSLL